MSPAPQKGRPSLDLRSNKSISLINHTYNRNANNSNYQSPYLPDAALIKRRLNKTNSMNNKIGHSSRLSCDSASIYENCKDLSGINLLNYSQTNINRINPKTANYETEFEEEYNIKNVKDNGMNVIKSGSSKRDTIDIDNINSTTKDTKDNRGDINNSSSNKYKTNSNSSKKYCITNNITFHLDYNTNLFEENELKNANNPVKTDNNAKNNLNKVKAGKINFHVSEFDANIEENDISVYEDCNKHHNQKLTFNASFPYNNEKGNKKDSLKVINDDHDNPSEYISLETNAKNFCCNSKNSKCLIM